MFLKNFAQLVKVLVFVAAVEIVLRSETREQCTHMLGALRATSLVGCTAQAPGPAGPTSAAASQSPGTADAPAGRLIPVRAAYSAISATQATLYITLKSGLFAKHGLDVDLRFIEANNSVAALIAQEVDIATVGGDLVASSVASGADLVILATPLNTYPQMLMAVPEITTAAELRGKWLGVSRFGAITDTAGRVALAHFGLRPNEDVELVQRSRRRAFGLIELDPDLRAHPELLELLRRTFRGDAIEWLFHG